MRVRQAELADVPILVEMGRRQVAALYGGRVADNPPRVRALTERLVTEPNSLVLVADVDGFVVGMIGMVLYEHHISGAKTAGEVTWWLEPEARGHGRDLLREAEAWAAAQGATEIQMMAPNERVGRLYERHGYHLCETTYSKKMVPSMAALADSA